MSQTLPSLDEAPDGLELASAGGSQTIAPEVDDFRTGPDQLEPSRQAEMELGDRPAVVELVIPVYNEEHVLEWSIRRLRSYLDSSFPFETIIRIVDNASTDGTWEVAARLETTLPGVTTLHLDRKGRGLALRCAWSASTSQIVAYMDVDLSTDLGSFLPLVAPLLSGHSDVSIGSRLVHGAHVVRGPKRELISRAYNLLVRASLPGHFSDAQCGFKALRRESAEMLLPLIEDDEWFFDTELLVAAERLGLRICEVPVDWVDDPDSRVKIWRTALGDLRGVWRISHGRIGGVARNPPGLQRQGKQVTADQLLRFAGVGAISTLAYVSLFMALRPVSGLYGANSAALAICTLFNLGAHRELARRMQGPAHRERFFGAVFALFAISVAFTSLALVAAHAVAGPSLPMSLLAVTAATAVVAVLRFAVLRAWVFRPAVAPR
jgi:glycosyltransferase involved in cell wall biosynthesis